MKQLKFTNKHGESILFGVGSSFTFTNITGLGEVEVDVQMQRAPYQDGGTFTDALLEPRPISFEVGIFGANDTDISNKRSQLSRVLNPKLGPGLLEYRYGDVVRVIDAIVEHIPNFPPGFENRGRRHQRALVDLICPNPYWRTLEITEEPAFESLFEFPFEGEFEFGMQRNDRMIFNDSDSPAPIQVDFYGPAQSPIIENLTTGEFIRINKRLEEGQTLKIDTGKSSVIYVDESGVETNVFNWIDLSSTFFMLAVGENDITCHCAISNNQRDFDIYYQKLYNAI